MKIGVPKEIKNNESRVGLTPESAAKLITDNNELFVETGAGAGIGFADEDYQSVGAIVLDSASKVYAESELIIKVKEPLPEEFQYLTNQHTLFTYLHLAANKQQARELVQTGITGIAYETVTAADGTLPLLAPMSAIAGQIGFVVGSYFLLKPNKGLGVLLDSIGDIAPRVVTVIGAGAAGTEAIKKAIATGAHVKIIDLSEDKLEQLKQKFGEDKVEYIVSTQEAIEEALVSSDLVIGSVYVIGKQAPKVITKDMIGAMKPGSVIVDIAIDQGGCIETSRPTTHDDPVFLHDGVIHYCVTNMPGAVPLTATLALNKATMPYIEALAKEGIAKALESNQHLANGLNMKNGEITHPAIKEALDS
ncbi:MAG: alanine dehydrogenase [Gammaproteobacteria bacterium]|nr:alanine dehydrogenase [Gammaproteobacteria bacterium]|tara:strand:- start:30764 stop:31852 length:1089 start_codon:yes stop_codon:yes gene_type:complete